MKQSKVFKIVGGEVFYNAANKTYISRKSREGLNNVSPETLVAVAVDGSDEDMNQIKYAYLSGIANLQLVLSEYMKPDSDSNTKIVGSDGEAKLLDQYDVTFEMEMPMNYDINLIDTLAVHAYNYCVYKCCADWFKLVSPTETEHYYSLATACMDNIRLLLNKRRRPMRRSRCMCNDLDII